MEEEELPFSAVVDGGARVDRVDAMITEPEDFWEEKEEEEDVDEGLGENGISGGRTVGD